MAIHKLDRRKVSAKKVDSISLALATVAVLGQPPG